MIEFAPKRPIIALTAIVLCQIVLLSFQVRTQDGSLLIRSWSLTALTPFLTGADWTASTVEAGFGWVGEVWEAKEENKVLKDEIEELRLELRHQRELAALLPRTLAYERIRKSLPFRLAWGTVVGRNPEYFNSLIKINLGKRHGVSGQDLAALVPSGIVGRVRVTSAFYSEVELITNRDAAAGALVGRLRLPGIVIGDGSPELKLENLLEPEKVKIEDRVITSGSDRIYPKGLDIGRVKRIERSPTGRYLITVEPATSLDRLEEVAVVLSGEPDDLAEQEDPSEDDRQTAENRPPD